MSTHFVMIVDADVTVDDAEQMKERVLGVFREKGLIAGEPNEECVMGGVGYPPGPACEELYKPADHKFEFWKTKVSGVEPRVGREFNYWALGPSFEGSRCPACGTDFGFDDREVWKVLIDALVEWVKETGPAVVKCPRCEHDVPIAEWECNPPHGAGCLAFTFWEWPRLDSPDWRINIPDLVREVTGHTIICTHGHF